LGFGRALQWLEDRFGTPSPAPPASRPTTQALTLPPPAAHLWPRVERYDPASSFHPPSASSRQGLERPPSYPARLSPGGSVASRSRRPSYSELNPLSLERKSLRPSPRWV